MEIITCLCLMKKIISFLKQESIDRLLFLLLVFLIPIQKRHVFFRPESFIQGSFNEWTSIFLYVTDIVAILIFIAWAIEIFRPRKMGKRAEFKKSPSSSARVLLCAFIGWAIISFAFGHESSLVYKLQSAYHVAKIGEFALLFFYIQSRINSMRLVKKTLHILVFSASVQALISVVQYIKQSSVGLKFFGEIDLGPSAQNIAKIIIRDEPREILIRPTALFPHANVLGGFLSIAFIFAIGLFIEEMLKRERKNKLSPTSTFLIAEIVLIVGALAYSYSRSAWIATFISVSLFLITLRLLIPLIFSHVFQLLKNSLLMKISFISLLAFLVFFIPLFANRAFVAHSTDEYATEGRIAYTRLAFEMIKQSPLLGVGPGNFTPQLAIISSTPFAPWQFQPVHNPLLVIAAEYGLIAALIVFLFMASMIKDIVKFLQKSAERSESLFIFSLATLCALIGIMVISLFDHYFFTVQQGALSACLVLGLASIQWSKRGAQEKIS